MFVRVYRNNLEKALAILKRKIQKDGILRETRNRRAALSKGERRRAKNHEAKIRTIAKRRKAARRRETKGKGIGRGNISQSGRHFACLRTKYEAV